LNHCLLLIEERDQRYRSIEQISSEGGELVELDFGQGVEKLVATQR
jgi:hypothetical protein